MQTNDVKKALKVHHPTARELIKVCVITYAQRDKEKNVLQVIPTAGDFPSLEANTSLLKSPDSDDDIEGVKVELNGDVYVDQKQTTVIELICDHSTDVCPFTHS